MSKNTAVLAKLRTTMLRQQAALDATQRQIEYYEAEDKAALDKLRQTPK